MKKPTELRGLINAITTPFNRDNTIDEGAFIEHFQWLYQHGVNKILVAGTTGEFFSITSEERKKLLRLAARHFNGHVMFHAGAGNLVETLYLAAFAAGEGAQSVAVILPYFLGDADDRALVEYLRQVGETVDVPFIIYNFPKHTQVRVTPHMLAEIPHFGLKDSSADLSLIPHTPNYYLGSDRLLLKAWQMGAKGFISGRSNVAPALYARMEMAILNTADDTETAQTHREVMKICDLFSGPRQIPLVKEGIARELPGYPTGVRLPLQ